MLASELPPAQLRVLLALIAVYRHDGRATITTVAACADRSRAVTHYHLVRLRRAGFVDWRPYHAGTLHPLLQEVHA